MSNQFRRTLSKIDKALAVPTGDDWASQLNTASLEAVRDEVSNALLSEQRRLRVRMIRGAVLGNAAPVHLALRLVSELNESVIEAANRQLVKPYKHITDDVRAKLGLFALPATTGSFVMELAAPPPIDKKFERRQPRMAAATEELPAVAVDSVTSIALDRVLLALATASVDDASSDAVAGAIVSLGFGGARHLSRMAARAESGDFSVEFQPRTRGEDGVAFTMTPAHAAWLRSIIRNRELDATEREAVGVLSTASTVRSLFDIVSDDGRKFSGSVEEAIRPHVSTLYKKRVRARFREYLDPSDRSGESISRVLVSIEEAPELPTRP